MDVSAFKSSNWQSMNATQRVGALQGLEGNMAQQQGRQPRTVKTEKMESGTNGYYSMADPQYVKLNADLVASPQGNYQAMQTTIHEGRHAYQDDCVRGRIAPQPQDQAKEESWKQNSSATGGVYNSPQNSAFVDYRYQPKEADANTYAKDQMNSCGGQLSGDPAYHAFTEKRDAQDRYTAAAAKSAYGDNYEQVIREDIGRRYEAKQEAAGQSAQNNSVNGGQKGSFDFKADKVQREKAPTAAVSSSASKYKAPSKPSTQSKTTSLSQSKGGQSR